MKKTVLLTILGITSMVIGSERTWGAQLITRCVDASGSGNYTDLQSALDYAKVNAAPVLIRVAQGTYTGNSTIYSANGYSLTLRGGYDPGTGCASRVLDPSLTILDGGGTGNVLRLTKDDSGTGNPVGSITVDGFTIQNGMGSTNDGGGLDVRSTSSSGAAGDITVTNSIFIGNSAAERGGGVFAYSRGQTGSGMITISNNTFARNSAGDDGGGIYAGGYSDSVGIVGIMTIQGNTCTENHAVYEGGGIYAESFSRLGASGDITLQENNCTKNTTGRSGGGIYAESWGVTGSGKISVEKNICTSNTADSNGGGIFVDSHSTSGTAGALLLRGNTVSGNTASLCGGINAGSHSNSGTGGPVSFVNNIVTGNTANNYPPGGVRAESSTNPDGGGGSSAVTFTNNTITQNSANQIGGAYLRSDENYVYVYNNIIWRNTGDDIFLYNAARTYGFNNNYSTLAGAWEFEGNNMNVDPRFGATGYWDNAGTPADSSDDVWVNGNYHLARSSPCIDKGLNTAPGIPNEDVEGDTRILNGMVDIGADESKFRPTTPAISPVLILILNEDS
jgi:predicted outer membrane repeat protein